MELPPSQIKLVQKEKTAANHTILSLDDVRQPLDPNVVWVKNYEEFVQYLQTHEMPDLISWDHDLNEENLFSVAQTNRHEEEGTIPYDTFTKKHGLDAAKYIVQHNLPLRFWQVHSANPVGADNIREVLRAYRPNGEVRIPIQYENTEHEVYGGRIRNGYKVEPKGK